MPWRLGPPRWARGLTALVGLVAAALWAGAALGEPPLPPAGSTRDPARWVFRDDLGQRIRLPSPPRRIACSGRDLCDLARALLGDEAVTELPAGTEEQHLRRGAADLVLLPAVTRQPGLARRLRARGWPAATLAWRDVGELPAAALRLAGWVHRLAQGRELAASYAGRLARIQAALAAVAPSQRPPVLVLAWDRPPVWAGPGSPAATLVERAGGRVVSNHGHQPTPARSRGGLSPLLGRMGRLAGPGAWLAGEEAWRTTRWPTSTRVVTPLLSPVVPPGGPPAATALYLPPDQLLGAGPQALEGLERLAAWLHPGRVDPGAAPLRMVPLPVAP
ncbi:MAG TPA: ABC transporter substrate-binding protein [Thermaerobacter sp.]